MQGGQGDYHRVDQYLRLQAQIALVALLMIGHCSIASAAIYLELGYANKVASTLVPCSSISS